jgi:hypothetical protein
LLQFGQLLHSQAKQLEQLCAEHCRAWGNRYAILGPLIRGLQLLHDHWAYRGVGRLRLQPADFCARICFEQDQIGAPVHELAGLANLLLVVVATHDTKLGIFDGSDTEEEGPPTLLDRPRPMSLGMADVFRDHIALAFASLSTPFPAWTPQFSEENLNRIHHLKACSGYAQVKYISLTCLECRDNAKWRHDLAAGAAAASRGWHSIFQPICRRNKAVHAAASLLLLMVCEVRPVATTVHSHQAWTTLRREFFRAAGIVGIQGGRPMLHMLLQGVNMRLVAAIQLEENQLAI